MSKVIPQQPGLKLKKGSSYTIKLNVVAMRGINDEEVLDFAHLIRKKPYHVRYINGVIC